MHHVSVSWHIIHLKFSSRNITLWTKRAHESTNFQILSALIKVDPIPHVSFGTTRPRFIQILHHCSVSWNIILCIFLFQTFILWTEGARRNEIFRLEWLSEKSTNSLSCFKLQAGYSIYFASPFSVMRDNSSVLF